MRDFRSVLCYRRHYFASATFLVLTLQTHIGLIAQNIALGTWRTHLSYHHISSVAFGDRMTFASGNLGVMLMDQRDNSVSTYSKINGLNGTSVSHIDYDDLNKQLLVTYTDGRFDVVTEESEIVGFDPTKNSTVVGSKKINHAFINDGIAYLSTDYGVIVFDMNRMFVKETWRGLGNAGQTLMVFQSAILGDSIFLATGKGVIAGALKDNLQDFNSWKRFDSGELNGPVHHVANFNNTIYSGVNTSGIFKYMGDQWVKTPFLQGSSFQSFNAPGANLYVAADNGLFRITPSDDLFEIVDQLIERPN
ncbi:MAG TPA: hypothetical protein VF141_13165, partial [Chryseolinea sp.]